MPNFLSKILSFGADKDLKAYQRIVEKINALEPTMQKPLEEDHPDFLLRHNEP